MEVKEPAYRWGTWLDYIQQREVVPILGSEIMTVEDEGELVEIELWIARRLAKKYEMSLANTEGVGELNAVVSNILRSGKETEAILYADVRDLVRDGGLKPPECLRKLARILDFDLFVTTTFDPLLEMALNEERFKGASKTVVIRNSLRKVDDLPSGYVDGASTTLVYLMGAMSHPPYFAITEYDKLEFFCRLQNKLTRPERLFETLKEKHLLVLGGKFPNWAGRYLLRTVRNDNLGKRANPTLETVVDATSAKDASLAWFVQHFSKSTTLYPQAGSIQFINELYDRWVQARGSDPMEQKPMPERLVWTPQNRVVFLSYARQDYESVRQLKAELERRGHDVWLDQAELQGGDLFDRKISTWISTCAVFIPVISIHTEMRHVGWFRREWVAAIERLPSMHRDVRFIFPVTVDETTPASANWVPDEFRQYHWTPCPGGVPPPDFLSNAFLA